MPSRVGLANLDSSSQEETFDLSTVSRIFQTYPSPQSCFSAFKPCGSPCKAVPDRGDIPCYK